VSTKHTPGPWLDSEGAHARFETAEEARAAIADWPRQQYEAAYVEWMDDSQSAGDLEERLAAALKLQDSLGALTAAGLTRAQVAEVHGEYVDFL
jgi:hypothetical protein